LQQNLTMRYILSLYANAFTNLDRNVWILAFAMFVNRTGSMVLLFTSLYLTEELKFSLAHAGIAVSFYGAGSILGSFAGGWLTDRKNYFDVMVFSLLSSGLILPTILLTSNLILISGIIFLYAFCADMFRPAMSAGIALYSTAENRTRSIGLIRLAINLGFSLGPLIGGVVAFYFGYKPLMIIDGFTSVLTAVVVIRYVSRKAAGKKSEDQLPRSDSKSVYLDYKYLFFILMVAMYGVCFFQLFASIPQYLTRVWNYNEIEMSLVLILNGLIVVVVEMPLMTALQHKSKYFGFIVLGALCVPVSLTILISGNGWLPVVLLYTLVITFSEILAMPFMMNFTLSRPPVSRRGEYAALYSIAFGIANVGAPLAGLGIADKYGFNTMFVVLISLGIVNTIGFWILKTKLEPKKNKLNDESINSKDELVGEEIN
jgi:predicted MFS family arabinose efflux permease